MNQEKINQINSRMEEIIRLSSRDNINTQTDNTVIIGGDRISREYLGEYNGLMLLKNILRENNNRISDIPYVNHDDVMIREDLMEDYDRILKIVNLKSLNYVDNSIKNENDDILQSEKNIAYENLNELDLDNKEEYIQKVESAKNTDEVYSIVGEAIDNEKEKISDDVINNNRITEKSNNNLEEQKNENVQNNIEKENFENLTNKKVEAINKVNELNVPNKEEVLAKVINAKSEDEIDAILNGKTVEEQDELDEVKKDAINKIDNSNLTDEDKEIFKNAINNANDKDFINSVMNSVNEKIKENSPKEGYVPVKEGEQLAVIPEKNKTPLTTINSEPVKKQPIREIDEEEHKVSKVRKAINFLKKHKKKILIGLGLTTLAATLFTPWVGPALMCANSKLWASTSIPFFRGVLHGANCVLASMINATEVSSGLWAFSSTGALINETAAASSLLGALAGGALQVASTIGVAKAIKEAKNRVTNWIKKKINKRKNKNIENDEFIEEDVYDDNDIQKDNSLENENTKGNDLINQLSEKRTQLVQMLSKANTTEQANLIQQEMIKLDSAIDIINNGRNTPIIDTVDYKGYRIKPEDVKKLKDIVEPKIENEETKSSTQSLKEKYQAVKDAVIKNAQKFKTPEDLKEGSIKR